MDKQEVAHGTSFGNAGILDAGYVLPFDPPAVSKWLKIALGKESSARMALPDGLKYLSWIVKYYMNASMEKRIECGAAMRPLIEIAVSEHKALLKNTDGEKYITDYGRAKIYRNEEAYLSSREEIEILEQYGVKSNVYTAEEFQEIEPDVKPIYKYAVTCESSARYTNPQKAINAMSDKFVSDGGEFLIEGVTKLEKTNEGWRVNDKYEADHVVICTGPWTNEILKPLGYKFPIAMKRGYHCHYQTNATMKHALIDAKYGYAICPMERGIRITTGAEFADRDTPANPVQLDQSLPYARELVDINQPLDNKPWLGARPCMADSIPVIGASKKHQGLWFNFGHGHVGLTAGPSSGKLLAQMLTGEKTFCEPKPYSPYRF